MKVKKHNEKKLTERIKSPPKLNNTRPVKTDISKTVTQPWQHCVFIAIIAIVTFICFKPAENNEFLKTWDDPAYVTTNKLLDGLTAKNISEIFSFHKDLQKLTKNYHPLTTLSLSINHQFAGLNPRSYYLTNIFIHIINSILVYLLIFLLTERRKWAALFSGILFGIHPMHVESVAWISERKDVLYAFFFIAGLIVYYYYLKKHKIKFLVFAFLLFVLSVLSKAMAVVFPVVLILVDILVQRKWSYRAVIEKIPFFIISGFFGMVAIRIQSEGAINDWQTFTLYQRFMHASYGFISYLYSFFMPFNLSAFYPYPFINEHGVLPLELRVSPFIFLFIMAISIGSLFVKNKMVRVFGFGMLFYFVTLALVLQFLSVGMAITADRYAYIPYIGIFFILGTWWSHLLEQRRLVYKTAGLIAGVIFMISSVVFAVNTHQRVAVWHDDMTLWTDVLNRYSDSRMNFIREKRANLNFNNQDFQSAMKDYQIMIALKPNDDNALERIGRIYGQQYHQLDSALFYFNKGYAANPDNFSILKNLGVAYAIKTEYAKSLDYFLQAYGKDPADTALMLNIAASYRAIGNNEKSTEFENLAHSKK